jgi:hypothetical protein
LWGDSAEELSRCHAGPRARRALSLRARCAMSPRCVMFPCSQFLRGVVGDLNARRAAITTKAFRIMDRCDCTFVPPPCRCFPCGCPSSMHAAVSMAAVALSRACPCHVPRLCRAAAGVLRKQCPCIAPDGWLPARCRVLWVWLRRDGSGFITLDDIKAVYNVLKHPDVLTGRATADKVYGDFLASFEGSAGNKDGKVSLEEFLDYYADIGSSIPSDDYYVEMMESCW